MKTTFDQLLVLGRQPSLGLAEAESLAGADHVRPVGRTAAVIKGDAPLPFGRMGGSIKLARVLNYLDTTDWQALGAYLKRTVPEHLQYVPEGKLRIGLSLYGFNAPPAKINALGLELKKIVKSHGRSVRIIPNKKPDLNSAQVLHNNLTGPTGWELLLVRDGNRTILAQTTDVQDIEAYAARDQARPARDARVGMLPPKLAQIILNLAVTKEDPKYGAVVLDPFCGTGVVLQEAALMGFDIYGSDLEPRMVEFTDKNLLWLLDLPQNRMTQLTPDKRYYKLEVGDATAHAWVPMPQFIAAETYLGRPFAALPDPQTLSKVIADCDTIHQKFLKNVARQTQTGFRMCIAVPAWQTRPDAFKHLPLLDHLQELGYNRIDFVHVDTRDLMYYRPDQIVARELVVLVRQ